jgi:COMPASS component SWD1
MKQEEEAVDIDGVENIAEMKPEPNGHTVRAVNEPSEMDEDALWADEEPDDDARGWKMKVIVGLEDDDI